MKIFSVFIYISIVLFINLLTPRYVIAEDCPCKRDSNKIFDQDFGMALPPDHFLTSMASPWIVRNYFRPWRHMASIPRDTGSTVKIEKDKFRINLDVQHFSPDEITVKTADGYVVIEAKHEEKKDDHGLVSRHFVRKYSLPEGAESEYIVSELSSDGILMVTAPRKVVDDKGERFVPITQTGPAREEAKEVKNDNIPESCDASGQVCNKV